MVSRFVFCLAFLPAVTFASFGFAQSDGILQIVVSKSQQSLVVYRDGAEIARSKVSTGKAGHDTPTGIFSILEKRKYHESNIYSNAPMPFMQRLTWSGIALHEGHVPAYPASHGCIRLPAPFARTLFGMTERGVHVIITEAPALPTPIEHTALFNAAPEPDDGLLLTDTPLRATQPLTHGQTVEVAMNEPHTLETAPTAAQNIDERAPVRILITRRGERERVQDIQFLLNELGFDAGKPDGKTGPATLRAANTFRLAHDLPAIKNVFDGAFEDALYGAAGKPKPLNGHLFVRSGFKELFETAIGIRDGEKEIGTHFFVTTNIRSASGKTEWTALPLENRLPDMTVKRLGITERLQQTDILSSSEALNRLDIPVNVRERVERLLGNGSSITITDNDISLETGKGTDFITLTKPGRVKGNGA